jgi:hypothetical protein
MIRRFLAPALPVLPLLLLAFAGPAQAETRREMITSFDRVRVEGPYEVRLVTGAGASAVVEADRRMLEQISVEVQGTTLTIATRGYDSHRASAADGIPVVVTLTTPALRGATVNAGGQLHVTGMKAQRIDLYVGGTGSLSVAGVETDALNATVMGSGSMTLAGRALRARLMASGPGMIDAAALATDDLNVRLDGAGEIRAAARATAVVANLGTGAVSVSGTPSCTISRAAGGPVTCGK